MTGRKAMAKSSQDPTEDIRVAAAAFPDVDKGTSCNQSSFKAGKGSFLFIGPGAKGVGFKAMFKVKLSRPEAESLAATQPDRFDVSSSAWVTARFTADAPLPRAIWKKWLQESYDLCCSASAKKVARPTVKKKAVKRKKK